jgi:SAM-dependent methyltransferase
MAADATLTAGYRLEDDTVPDAASGSAPYTRKEYWDSRFQREEHHEWLAAYCDVRDLVRSLIPRSDSTILLVGCGNSRLAQDMAADGYTAIVSTDYSEPVIERMRERAGSCGGRITWEVQDMTSLSYDNGAFDVVFDKAAMDAVLADGGDTWSPPEELLEKTDRIMSEAARVLKPGGLYMQLSFGQPHFRKKYLLNKAPAAALPAPAFESATVSGVACDAVQPSGELWAPGSFQRFDVPVGFGYFLYTLRTP